MPKEFWGRRSLISGLSATVAALIAGSRPAAAQTAQRTFEPARHAQDEWFDTLPGKHRVILDATSAQGASEAAGFTSNLFTANKDDYGLEDKDLAFVVCLRHSATVFAFNDAMWAKYGAKWAEAVKYTNPRSTEPPKTNPYIAGGRGYDALAKRGVHFAVCGLASRRFARTAAGENGDADAILKEMKANTLPNAHIVAAGVVGVTRAQEYGYTVLHVG